MTRGPRHIHLDRARGLTLQWDDESSSFYPVEHLRKYSPSAEARQLREELEQNPLAVLPASSGTGETLQALNAELVGNYALRIHFSDGHDTGIYTWEYLRTIDPGIDGGEPDDTKH